MAERPQRRLSRREMLRTGALAFGALAACSVPGTQKRGARPTLAPLPARADELVIANWELYIDPNVPGEFERATGIDTTYREAILDNEQFFGTIREELARGRASGWDVIVVTDWLVAKMARLGYLEPLHLDALPNFAANVDPLYVDPDYDPGNVYSVPWQTGFTGIAYNERLTGRPITSTQDLFDPAFAGKVGMFTEMRDTMNLMLLGIGVSDLQEATEDDLRAVTAKLEQQKRDGIVRGYYDNSYVDLLARGDLALTIAWSGDVLQLTLDEPDLHFVVPQEGGIVWVDAMVIPKGAAHPADAHVWMNHVFDVEVAASIAEEVQYITPVQAAKGVLLERGATEVAQSPLVFPTDEMKSRVHSYKLLDEDEEQLWNELFNSVAAS